MKKGLLRDKLYVRSTVVKNKLYKHVVKRYTHEHEKYLQAEDCRQCNIEFEGEPPCEFEGRDSCPKRILLLPMYDIFKIKKKNYLSVWRGDIPKLLNTFKGFRILDRRSTAAHTNNLKFTGQLRKYQIEAILPWLKARYGGFITAPARSGKTVIGAYLACELKLKTLVLVHQKDLADQFFETFEDLTNMKKYKKACVIASKGNIVDLVKQDYDVILSTYQTFISPAGKLRLAQIRNAFGLCIVDEAHLVGADCFSHTVTGLNTYFNLGLTATPDRKDKKDVLAKHAIGPVVSHVEPPQMKGHATFVHTGFNCGSFSNWSIMLNRVAKNRKRNKIIIQYALEDVKKGYCILMVTERVHQVKDFGKIFKEYGIKVCMLHGKVEDRKSELDKLRKNKYQVTIATRRLVQYGVNVPPWSCYYCLSPSNNKPNFYQEMSRVRTPWVNPKTKKKKKKPLLRIFVDSHESSKRCMYTCRSVCIEQGFTIENLSISGEVMKKVRKRTNPFDKFLLGP